jgi:hypothetical protein
MALRLGLFYTAASLSGAFGGLLARGLTSIGKRGGQAQWSWIFIIEGLFVCYLSAWLLVFTGTDIFRPWWLESLPISCFPTAY